MLALFNQMYVDVRIMDIQKHGKVVSIHKTDVPITPADYKPITWLNTEYKIPARIRKNRLRPTLSDMLHQIQDCGVSENTIFDAVAKALDAIACVELTHPPSCILSLHFTEALDRISPTYLFRTLKVMTTA
jgi:hypothetical protein